MVMIISRWRLENACNDEGQLCGFIFDGRTDLSRIYRQIDCLVVKREKFGFFTVFDGAIVFCAFDLVGKVDLHVF